VVDIQKTLLRVVFGSLALAACFGAAAVIFVGHDTLWRIGGTCATTAFGALLLFGASSLFDREPAREPGVLATALVVTEYVLTLGLIWNLFGRADGQAGFTLLYVAVTGIPAIASLALMARPVAAVAGRVGVAACATDFALLMIGVWGSGWGGRTHFDDNRWFDVGGALAAFAFLAVLALVGAGRDRRHWRWAGVAAAGTGFALSTYAIILDIHRTSSLLVCITTVAVVVAHTNAMMLCPLRPGQRWLRGATIGAAIVTGVLVDVQSLTKPWQNEMLGRLAGAAAIIAGCGTLALLVLARINRRIVQPGLSAAEVREIVFFCPLCGTRQKIAIGDGRCAMCGMGIEVRLAEPFLSSGGSLP
jgi:hypothetical protein